MVCSDTDADIQVGDVIVTSGVGSIYPYGLTLGKVASIEVDEYSRELIVYIDTSVDFAHISRVMVIGTSKEASENE